MVKWLWLYSQGKRYGPTRGQEAQFVMKVRDFCRVRRDNVEWYMFRFGGGTDFAASLEQFKALVPLLERSYEPTANHRWGVKVEFAHQPPIAAALAAIFENWASCVETLVRQMPLPGFSGRWRMGKRPSQTLTSATNHGADDELPVTERQRLFAVGYISAILADMLQPSVHREPGDVFTVQPPVSPEALAAWEQWSVVIATPAPCGSARRPTVRAQRFLHELLLPPDFAATFHELLERATALATGHSAVTVSFAVPAAPAKDDSAAVSGAEE